MTTPYGILIGAEVIWDSDHGASNAGWYLRTKWDDGDGLTHEEDDVFDALQALGWPASDEELRNAVLIYLAHPDGMTDQQRNELRSMIRICRRGR